MEVLNTALLESFQNLEKEAIPEERKKVLWPLVKYIHLKLKAQMPIHLHFICTHNSRRSQLAQVLAQAIGHYFDVSLSTYSGGTKATAFNEQAVQALGNMGFHIEQKGTSNPHYLCSYSEAQPPVIAFSKKFDDPINPTRDFAAIMTCSEADQNCPYIPGAEQRFPIRYEDPKIYDGTIEAAYQYANTARQIAREMLYVFSQVVAS
jgi:arsenate reductase